MLDDRSTILTEAQLDAFETDGVIHLRGVLANEEVDLLRSAVDQQMARAGQSSTAYDFQKIARQFFEDEEADVGSASRFDIDFFRELVRSDPLAKRMLDEPEGRRGGDEGRFFYEVAGWVNYEEVRKVALDSLLPRLSYELLRTSYVNFWEDTTFVKEPGATNVTAFHSDYGYFQISGEKCVIVWVPLDKADEETGALEVVRGSHRWGKEFQPNVFFAQTPFPGTPGERLPDIEANRDDYDIVRYDADPGDVVVCHVRAIHGAGGNKSVDRARRAVSLRYVGDDVRYHDKPGALQQSWLTHKLQTGDRLFDPDYPLVYPKPYPDLRVSDFYSR